MRDLAPVRFSVPSQTTPRDDSRTGKVTNPQRFHDSADANGPLVRQDMGTQRNECFPQLPLRNPHGRRNRPRVEKLLNYDPKVIDGIQSGEAESLRFVSDFWAFTPSERDKEQFRRFCTFVRNDVI